MKIIVVATEYTGKTPREKVTAAENTGNGILNNSTPFPDGNTVGNAMTSAANQLKTALDNYDVNPSEANRDIVNEKETGCDLKMDDCVGYVQSKVNNQSNPDIAMNWVHLAALEVKKQPTKKPKPEVVTDAKAEFSNIPETILLKIKKKSKYSVYFEVWISLTPEDESSWAFKDSTMGKQLLVEGLTTGQKYYMRIIACNLAGKSEPSEIYYQIAA